MPYDNFVLTLARSADGEGALFEQRVGAGARVAVRGRLDVHQSRARQCRQRAVVREHRERARGAAAAWCCSTICARACRRTTIRRASIAIRACYKTVFIVLGLWLVWVLGSTRLRAPAIETHDPSEAELVRRAGGLIARTVAPHHTAHRAVRSFLRRRRARGAPRGWRKLRARRAVALARAPRRHPAAGARSAQNLVRGCACGAQAAAGTAAEPSRHPGKTTENMNTVVATFEQSVQREIARVIVGAEDVIRALCIALIARGHVLVQGPPGLGKTLLAKTLARVLGGEFKRVQGTADLMPSDIVGTHVFDASKNEFVFRRGPLFADVLLVDEINRTGPKTQSALLEAMEERQVSSERDHVSAAGGFPGAGDAEPARLRRHLSTAGVAARPLHAAHRHELPGTRGRGRDPQALRHRARGARRHSRRPRPHRSRAAAPGARRGERAARVGGAVELRARPGAARRASIRAWRSDCRRAARWR